MNSLERGLRALQIAVYGFVILELLNIAIQFGLLVAADIATGGVIR
jgi:hypothetical protein